VRSGISVGSFLNLILKEEITHRVSLGGSNPSPATKKLKIFGGLKNLRIFVKNKKMKTIATYYYEAYEEHSATGDTMSI